MKLTIALNALFAVGLAAPNRHGIPLAVRSTTETSINWSGAVIQDTNITSVAATFSVLNPKVPTVNETGKDAYLGSAWIGIDGYNTTACPKGLWQAGVMSEYQVWNGMATFQAW